MNPQLFIVTATGNTYAHRASLSHWDFDWYRDEKVWRARRVSAGMLSMFQAWTRSAEWEGIELTVAFEEK